MEASWGGGGGGGGAKREGWGEAWVAEVVVAVLCC